MNNPRATKIVATLGPSTSSAEMIEKLIAAGVNVVRMNFSHGSAQDHKDRAGLVRAAADKLGKDVGILEIGRASCRERVFRTV